MQKFGGKYLYIYIFYIFYCFSKIKNKNLSPKHTYFTYFFVWTLMKKNITEHNRTSPQLKIWRKKSFNSPEKNFFKLNSDK